MQNIKSDISDWNDLSRAYIPGERLNFLVSTCVMSLLCFLIYVLISSIWIFYAVLGVSLLLFMISFIIFLRISRVYYSISYRMDMHAIYLRRGVLLKKEIITPINKIYQIKIKQGPILKRFNLFSVEFVTAVDTVEIPYINYSIAEYIYRKVNKNIDKRGS